jgi:acetyl-CoA carboxylase biotin carboxylase subunit
VAVHSTVDRNALHVQLADEAVCVGEAPSSRSYLNIPNILAAATSRGADAIHPGYGFLAENDRFAEICGDHGITFVGPSPESIRAMGDKSTAKATMQAVGVPTIPGSEGLLESPREAAELAERMGYPVMIKATAGGGGRGMRLVPGPEQLENLFKAAQGEAEAAFGNPGLYMEKFIDRPRHVEVQVLADRHGNVVHLGERDCSIQRRHQKLLEEAPSPGLDPELRRRMGDAAVAADEHPHPGGASGHRDGHRHRPDRRAAADRRRRADLGAAGGGAAQRPRDRVPHQRGRPLPELPAGTGQDHRLAASGGPRGADRQPCLHRL